VGVTDKMKRRNTTRPDIAWCLLIALLLSACATPQAKPYEMKEAKDANWDRYQPSDLQFVIDEHSKHIDFSPNAKMSINAIAANYPYRVKVMFMNEYRNISEDKKQLVDFWGKAVQIDDKFIKAFGHEMLFKHGSTLFWFPVQSPLLPDFKKELKKGDEVNLYTMFVGTVWEGDQMQWVFIVNEFRKVQDK